MQVPYEVCCDDLALSMNYGYPLASYNIGSIRLLTATEATLYNRANQTDYEVWEVSAADDAPLCEEVTI